MLSFAPFFLSHRGSRILIVGPDILQVIQHDASFTRPDIAFCPDQSVPDLSLVESFMSYSSNGKTLSIKDLATYSGDRRAACKQANGQYSLTYSFRHKFFGKSLP